LRGVACWTRTFAKFSTRRARCRSQGRLGTHSMPRAKFQIIALAGCAALGGCNDTRNLAPATPDTPAQFRSSNEEPPAPAPAAIAPAKFTTPPNTTVELPPPADIDANHVYALVELIDIAQRRNPATRVAWEQARQAAIKVGIAQAAYLPELT